MNNSLHRRQVLRRTLQAGAAGLLTAAATVGSTHADSETNSSQSSTDLAMPLAPLSAIRYCLNTSTIREHKLPLDQEVALCAKAGYDGIEPWIREIEAFQSAGGSLEDLAKQIADAGMTVDSAIGFARWIVDDPTERAKGIESLKRDMDLVKRLGGTRIAAPPVGATDKTDLNLFSAAERFAEILKVGRQIGVTPQLEVWGFSKSLSRLGEVMFVASEAAATDALLLPDVYHLFKGGSDFRGLALVAGSAIEVMHLNDYPADPPRETISDKDRVYPGDGVAPLANIIHLMRANGFAGTFSLELFNPSYWKQPAEQVVTTGAAKNAGGGCFQRQSTGLERNGVKSKLTGCKPHLVNLR